jgi:hypothetical protein
VKKAAQTPTPLPGTSAIKFTGTELVAHWTDAAALAKPFLANPNGPHVVQIAGVGGTWKVVRWEINGVEFEIGAKAS